MADIGRNLQDNRGRRTRDLLYSAAMAGAAAAVGPTRSMLTGAPTVPRGLTAKVLKASHEPKNADLQATGNYPGTNNWALSLLNGVAQGSGGTQRTGRQVQLESLELHLISVTDPTSLSDDVVRVVVFVDKESRGGTAAVGDVFSQAALNADILLMSPYNFDNVPTRFKVLSDEVVILPTRMSPTTTTANTTLVPYVRKWKLKQRVHFYNTAGATAADIDSGAVFVALMSHTPTKVSTYSLNTRITYRDL